MGARELDQISRREAPFDDMQRGIARGRRDSDHSDDSGRHCSRLTPSYDRKVPYALGIDIAPVISLDTGGAAAGKSIVDADVAALRPSKRHKLLSKGRGANL